jgi:solute carrier family 25 carnitine/acylcarnitine transporter 20/29
MNYQTSFKFSTYFEPIIAGSLSGFAATSICHPLDTIRTRIQSSNHTTIYRCVSSLIKTEGVFAFYRGFLPPFSAQVLYKSIIFSVNEYSRKQLSKFTSFNSNFNLIFFSGLFSGLINSIVVTPIELIRNKQMLQNNQNSKTSVYNDIKIIIRQYGLIGLWRGFTITCFRDGPGLGLYFLSYEKSKEFINPLFNTKDYFMARFLSGSCAGIVYWLYALPIDTIKTIIQSDNSLPHQRKSSIHDFFLHLKTSKESGLLLRIFRAYPTAIVRGIVSAGVTLSTYEFVIDILRNQK